MSSENQILIFTDGAASGNPGPGGWGCIVCANDRVKELGGGEPHTTNNRMELVALIQALSTLSIRSNGSIRIYSDSAYVLNGAEKYLPGWKNRGWKTVSGDPVKNLDLWLELDRILQPIQTPIHWVHLPAHEGIPGNERCDQIAVSFSKNVAIELYEGALNAYSIDLQILNSTIKPNKKPWYISVVNGELKEHTTWSDCESRVKGKKGVKFKKVHSDYEEKAALDSWGYKKK